MYTEKGLLWTDKTPYSAGWLCSHPVLSFPPEIHSFIHRQQLFCSHNTLQFQLEVDFCDLIKHWSLTSVLLLKSMVFAKGLNAILSQQYLS